MIAVIDIGSNSVRMLAQYIDRKDKYIEITRLSEGLSLTGILNKNAIKRTVKAVRYFCQLAISLEAEHIFLFATEAVRSASNGHEFVYSVKVATGLNVDVLSGDLEARIGFAGVSGKGKYGIIDIGGASTEVTIGDDAVILYTKSCPLGTIRLTDLFGQDEALMKEYLERNAVYENTFACEIFRAVGGTAATLAAIDLKLKQFSGSAIEGHILTLDNIVRLKDTIFSLQPEKRKMPGLHPSRRKVISAGCMILLEVMNILKIKSLSVSDSDNLEGYIKYKLS